MQVVGDGGGVISCSIIFLCLKLELSYLVRVTLYLFMCLCCVSWRIVQLV